MVYGALQNNQYEDNEDRPIKPFYLLLVFMAFFAFYAFLHAALHQRGILHPALMLFSEKALLVWKGFPPRLENFGFLHPPLPILIIGLVNGNLLLAQALVSALISTALAGFIWKAHSSPKHVWPLMIYLVFSFPILFVATERFDLYLYFFVVSFSAKFLYHYEKEERLLDLFLAGPCLSAAFFIHFSAIYLVPMFFVLICGLYRNQPKMILPVTLTFFTPSLAAFALLAGVTWIFTSDPFLFLRQGYSLSSSLDIEAAIASGNFINGFFYMIKHVVLALPVILPYFMGFRYQRTPLLMLPFMILLSLIYTHVVPPPVYVFSAFIIYFLLMTEGMKQITSSGKWLLLGISLLSAPVAASFSMEPHERSAIHAFLETGKAERPLKPLQKVVERLESAQGKILLDDAHGYPLVYLMKNMERFILPYQYEFAVALSNPVEFVDYAVAVKNRQNDLIMERFKNPVKSFQKQFEDEKIIIWERIS